MRITCSDQIVSVSDIRELGAATVSSLQSELRAAIPAITKQINIDLSDTDFVDCGGLGALVALRKCARTHGSDMTIRLLNPPLPLRRMIELMRMQSTFQIEQQPAATTTPQPTRNDPLPPEICLAV